MSSAESLDLEANYFYFVRRASDCTPFFETLVPSFVNIRFLSMCCSSSSLSQTRLCLSTHPQVSTIPPPCQQWTAAVCLTVLYPEGQCPKPVIAYSERLVVSNTASLHRHQRMDVCCSNAGDGVVTFYPDCYSWCHIDVPGGDGTQHDAFRDAMDDFKSCLTNGENSTESVPRMVCNPGSAGADGGHNKSGSAGPPKLSLKTVLAATICGGFVLGFIAA